MVRTIISLQALFFLIAFNAWAQSCYLSSECANEQWCINKTCTDSNEPLTVCEKQRDCVHHFECISGVCKPDGIYCENDYGYGIENVNFGLTSCDSGIAAEWMADIDCEPGSEGCSVPGIEDRAPTELKKISDVCVASLKRECEAPPIPEDMCSTETLGLCTDWVLFVGAAASSCEDVWTSSAVETNNTSSIDTDVAAPSRDTEEMFGDDTGDAQARGINISGLYNNMRGLSGSASPYSVVHCCEAIENDAAEIEMYEEFLDCTSGLAVDDCEEIEACRREIMRNYGWNSNATLPNAMEDDTLADTPAGAKNDDESVTVGMDSGEESDGESTNATDGSVTGELDTGCSMALPASTIGSLLHLIL